MSDKLMLWLLLLVFVIGIPAAIVAVFSRAKKQSAEDSAALAEFVKEWDLEAQGSGRFRGEYQGRGLAISKTVQGSSSERWNSALKLSLELAPSSPHQGYARCARSGGRASTFEQAFPKARMGLETLTPAQKTALTEFVNQHGCLFFEAEKAPHRLGFTFRQSQLSKQQVGDILAQLDKLAAVLEEP